MTETVANPHRASLEQGLGVAVSMLGVAVLFGWALDIGALKSVLPGLLAMKANTAAAFMLCGLALAVSAGAPAQARRGLAVLFAGAAALVGGLTFVEHIFSLDFGIDELLFLDPGPIIRITPPGRMSSVAAFCFVLMAVALALSALPKRLVMQLPLAATLSATVAVISVLYLAGQISNRMLGFRWGSATLMATNTAFAFTVLGLATLLRVRRLQGSAWALGQASTAGFATGVVLMLFSAELTASFAQDMQATTAAVVRTQQTLSQLQEVRTDLRTLESAQRSHMVLGDDALLSPRAGLKASVHERLASLAGVGTAPAGEAPPADRLEALRQAIAQRLAFGDRLIKVRQSEGFDAARALLLQGEDSALTARITEAIAPIVQLARDRLAERQSHLNAVSATTLLLLPIGSFLGLTALLAGLFFLEHGAGTRRRAEQALARSRAQLGVVFDSLSEGIRVIDRGHRIVRMNPAGASVHGLIEPAPTLDALMAQVEGLTPAGKTMAEDDWPSYRALRGDFVRNFEMVNRRRDTGAIVVVEINTAPLPAEPGQEGQVVVTSHDVTERKRAEAAAREGRDRLEQIVENLSEGLLIQTAGEEKVRWNRAALELHGLKRSDAEAMTRQEFRALYEMTTLTDERVPFERWPLSCLMRGEALHGLELRLCRLDREWERIFSFSGARVHDTAGQPLVFLTMTDITDRKAAEGQLQQLNADLESRVLRRTSELLAKTRELESFCYSVSHDLKAPLRGIEGYSRLLSDDYADKLDADGRMFLGNVRQATTQMNQLIDDLLAYSQQERRSFVPARIRLRGMVEAQLARSAANLAGVQLSVEVEDVRVRADREGLAMALRNLIDNAIKFSARALPPVIAIHSARVGRHCVLSVQDNGTGFDMRHYDKIFEIFQRLHRAEDYPGTGVGLALVRKAMAQMGGRVWAQSQPGAGATFYLELEAVDAADPAATTY